MDSDEAVIYTKAFKTQLSSYHRPTTAAKISHMDTYHRGASQNLITVQTIRPVPDRVARCRSQATIKERNLRFEIRDRTISATVSEAAPGVMRFPSPRCIHVWSSRRGDRRD